MAHIYKIIRTVRLQQLQKTILKQGSNYGLSSPFQCNLGYRHFSNAPKSKLIETLFVPIAERESHYTHKVTIVGTGQVGMAAALALLAQRLTTDLCLIDMDEKKLQGETLDLQHGSGFARSAKIVGTTRPEESASSRLIIVTAGARQKQGEDRLSLVQRNTDIVKTIIPQLVKVSPEAVILMVNNPVDVMSYVAWKSSGLPVNRVLGTGTYLDTARFRYELSKRLNIAVTSCHGWIIGEHGDTSVPVWSGVEIAGVRLRDIYPELGLPNDPEKWNDVHKSVIKAAYTIIQLKGYTSWAIGLTTASVASCILNNEGKVLTVCTSAKGKCGIDKDVWCSLPCVVTSTGVTAVIQQTLDCEEQENLKKSVDTLLAVQQKVKL